ncbi:hypothetical protein GC176_16020 [bacterium]|nr:hypothetical protein [bacterium]
MLNRRLLLLALITALTTAVRPARGDQYNRDDCDAQGAVTQVGLDDVYNEYYSLIDRKNAALTTYSQMQTDRNNLDENDYTQAQLDAMDEALTYMGIYTAALANQMPNAQAQVQNAVNSYNAATAAYNAEQWDNCMAALCECDGYVLNAADENATAASYADQCDSEESDFYAEYNTPQNN